MQTDGSGRVQMGPSAMKMSSFIGRTIYNLIPNLEQSSFGFLTRIMNPLTSALCCAADVFNLKVGSPIL